MSEQTNQPELEVIPKEARLSPSESKDLTVSNYLKLTAAILESIMAIPILGGFIVVTLVWIPLFVALIIHILALVFSIREKKSKLGPILGIVTSLIAWIPFVGFIMHVITAIFNWIGAFDKKHVI
jgi:hypothetical protein